MHTIDRRRFLALSAASLTLNAAASAWAAGRSLPLGIQLYAVREPLATDTPGTLRQLRAIGFETVETAGFGKYSAAEFSKLVRDAGLRVPSAHLPFSTASDLGPVFADAHALGAEYATSSVLRTFPMGAASAAPKSTPPLPPMRLDDFKRTAARMNEIGRAAQAAGLKYAYHNHNFEFEKMPDGSFGYDLLLRETDPALVFFEADCGWLTAAGGKPETYLRQYPGRFRMLHIKDFKPLNAPTTQLVGPGRPEGTELGRGFVQYKAILAAAPAAGVQYVFAEQEAPYVRPQLESAKVSYDFMKSLV